MSNIEQSQQLHKKFVDEFLANPEAYKRITNYGIMYAPPTDNDHVVGVITNNALFDEHVVNFLSQYVTEGSTVIDVGCNRGQMSLFFSQIVGATGFVESIEASDYLAMLCKHTFAVNDFAKNIRLHHAACWNESGVDMSMLIPSTAVFSFYSGQGLKTPFKDDDRTEYMPEHNIVSLAIDDIEFKSPVSAIKVDIQGSDLHALRGAKKTIAKYRPALAIEYEPYYDQYFDTSMKAYEDFLEEIGYEIVKKERDGVDWFCLPKSA